MWIQLYCKHILIKTALSSNGEVYSWGYGKEGSLGLGTLDNQAIPKKVN